MTIPGTVGVVTSGGMLSGQTVWGYGTSGQFPVQTVSGSYVSVSGSVGVSGTVMASLSGGWTTISGVRSGYDIRWMGCCIWCCVSIRTCLNIRRCHSCEFVWCCIIRASSVGNGNIRSDVGTNYFGKLRIRVRCSRHIRYRYGNRFWRMGDNLWNGWNSYIRCDVIRANRVGNGNIRSDVGYKLLREVTYPCPVQ